jgi:hypothetical protein
MDLGDFLKTLALDAWYKLVLYFGGAILCVSFFLEVKGVTNAQLQLLSGGFFLIGLGEWKNHKEVSWIEPPNVYTGGPAVVSNTVRRPDLFGILLECFGVVLMLIGAWGIFRS